MDDRFGRSFYSLEGSADNMLSRLGQYLDRHVVRDQVLLDQCPQESVFRLGSGRKSHLDLLKPDLHKEFKELHLLFKTHRDHQGLVSVAEIRAAPDRSFVHICLLRPFHAFNRRHKRLSSEIKKSSITTHCL